MTDVIGRVPLLVETAVLPGELTEVLALEDMGQRKPKADRRLGQSKQDVQW